MKILLPTIPFIIGLITTYGLLGWYEDGTLNNYANLIPILVCGVLCFLIATYSQRVIKSYSHGLFVSVLFSYLIIATIVIIIAIISGTLDQIIPWKFLIIRIGTPILFPLILMSWVAVCINQMRSKKQQIEARTFVNHIKKMAFPSVLFLLIIGSLFWYGNQNQVARAYYEGLKEWYFYNWTPYRIRIGSNAYLHTSSPLPYIPKEWLIERTTYDFLEIHYNGKENRWHDIKNIMKEHDELWLYRSPPETWKALAGVEGYALVRKGKAVSGFITSMN